MKTQAKEAARSMRAGFDQKIPIDVHAIAEAHGILVREETLEESVSGMLVIKEERAAIAVNADHATSRKRFSIAHELGHFALHRGDAKLFIDADGARKYYRDGISSEGVKQEEIDANAFAAELLMPEDVLRREIGQDLVDPSDEGRVRQLATAFGVSAQAMAVRLTVLGVMLVKYGDRKLAAQS